MSPTLEPYFQQVLPQGQLDVQASPQDFGSAVGQGLENVGTGIESANDSVRQVQDDKAKVWAIRSASDARIKWINQMNQMQTDPDFQKKYGADGSGFSGAFQTNFEDYANQAIGDAPTPQAKKYLDAHMRDIGTSLMEDAQKFQASVGAKWAVNNLQTSLEQDGRSAFSAPDKFDQVLKGALSSIDTMPHLDEAARLEMKANASENIAFAAGKGMSQSNPEATLAFLKPDELAKLKPTARVQAIIRGDIKVQLPQNTGGDLVKPYTADRVAEIAKTVAVPSPYDEIFRKAGAAYGIDPMELKMRAAAESSLKPDAQGPQTAYGQSGGIMQLTEATAASLGVTDRNDPQQSIFGAAKLLADLKQKAGGNEAALDKMYYGGGNSANWGANTSQYAENLAAVRASIVGGDAVHSTFDQVLSSVLQSKDPIRSSAAPSWFNELPWEKQYQVIEDAKQGVVAEATRAAQLQELQEKQRKLQERQTMSGMMDKLIDGTLTVDAIRKDPTLDYEGKKYMLDAMSAGITGRDKTDPAVFDDAFRRIHAPDGTQNRITDEKDLVALVGHGIDYADLGKLRNELQGKESTDGKVLGDMKTAFMEQAKARLVKSSLFSGPDPIGAQKYYNFQQAFMSQWETKIKAGKSGFTLLDPNSPDYMGGLIDSFQRSPLQVMKDQSAAMRGTLTQPAQEIPVFTNPADPKLKDLPVGAHYKRPDPSGTLIEVIKK